MQVIKNTWARYQPIKHDWKKILQLPILDSIPTQYVTYFAEPQRNSKTGERRFVIKGCYGSTTIIVDIIPCE